MNAIPGPEIISSGAKTVAMMFMVLGFLVLALYGMKKGFFFRSRSRQELIIRVLSSFSLSAKERIEVIEISGERLVLGITPGNIRLLTKLNTLGSERGEPQGVLKDDLAHGTQP